jgi:hypothetical protein
MIHLRGSCHQPALARIARDSALTIVALTILMAANANAFTIHGTLENGTTGDKHLSAKVEVVKPSGGMLQERVVEAHDGRFEIPDLDPNAPIYLVRVEYDGVAYNSPVQVDGADQDVAVVVYERTTSWAGVRISMPHLAATRSGDLLQIEQLYEITNESSPPRTITGGDAFFHLFLPADMDSLTACFVTTFGVPVDRTPVPTDTPGRYTIEYPIRPGVTRVGVAFTLPYASGRYALSEKLFHDVEQATVFAVDPDIKISSSSHTLEAMEPVHGMSAYSVHGLAKDTELVLSFEGGDPNFAGTGGGEGEGDGSDQNVLTVKSDSESLSLFLIAALAFTFAGMVAVVLRDRGDPLSDPKVLRRHYDSMVARLARLDDLHAAEAIPGDAYRAAREELVTRTAALAIRLRAQDTTTHQPAPLPGQAAPAAAPQTKAR